MKSSAGVVSSLADAEYRLWRYESFLFMWSGRHDRRSDRFSGAGADLIDGVTLSVTKALLELAWNRWHT